MFKEKHLDILRSPKNGTRLRLIDNKLVDEKDNTFPVINDIPRFVGAENYAESFGYQWNYFDQTQLDRFSKTSLTETRFFKNTRWTAEMMKDRKVLEVGSGAGRFTEVILKTGADVYSVDYSNAVEANKKNNGDKDFLLAQANIYELPFVKESFDFVFCFGVIQHTPDPKLSFMKLVEEVKVNGYIAVDIYKKTWKSLFNTKYWFRPITKRMNKEKLLRVVKWYVPKWFPVSTLLLKVPFIGRFLSQLVPILNYKEMYPELSKEELVTWAILDTFDMLSPAYDYPQTLNTISKWGKEAGLQIIYCGPGDNGFVLVGRRIDE